MRRINPEAGVQASVSKSELVLPKTKHRFAFETGASVCVERTLFQTVGPTVAGTWCRRDAGLSPKRCSWVEPVLVDQVKFTEWTRDGRLRQPVFLGLRDDKQAKDVVRE